MANTPGTVSYTHLDVYKRQAFSEVQRRSFEKYERAEAYRKYAIKRRDTKYISAALKEARPMIQIEQRVLDADEFLLNLPSGTCDLRTGAVREHNAQDYITKQTAVDPVSYTHLPNGICEPDKSHGYASELYCSKEKLHKYSDWHRISLICGANYHACIYGRVQYLCSRIYESRS